MMQISRGGLPLMLGSYAKNYDINLYMKGAYAYTNGQSIVIPRLHLDDSDSLEMAYGYVAHECGHIRYSDFNILKELSDDHILKSLFNAIEDPRIELLQIKDWPGLANTFNFLVAQLKNLSLKCLKDNYQDPDGDCSSLLLMFCNYYLRYKEVKQMAAQELYETSRTYLCDKIGTLTVKTIEQILLGTSYEQTSLNVLKRAKQVIQLVNKLCSLSNIENDELRNMIIQNEELDSETDDSYKLDPNLVQSITDDFQKKSKNKTPIKFSTKVKDNLALVNYGIKEYLNEKSDSVDIEEEFGFMQAGFAQPRENSNLLERIKINPSLMCNLKELAKGYDLWNGGYSSNGYRIDIPRYAKRKAGLCNDTKIFQKKILHRCQNTTIHLLVDTSGSMYNRSRLNGKYRFDVANEVALSLALAFEGCNHLDTEVTYFPGVCTEFETVAKPKSDILSRAAYFDQRPRGGTPMAQALMHAIYGFEKGSFKRNIVLIITDGDPDNAQSVKDLIVQAEQMNIEIYSIRIGHNTNCPNLFPHEYIVDDVNELSAAMTSMLSSSFFKPKY